MVRQTELLKALRTLARAHAVELELLHEGGAHSVYRCGPAQFTIPRHTHINDNTARAILRHVSHTLAGKQDQ